MLVVVVEVELREMKLDVPLVRLEEAGRQTREEEEDEEDEEEEGVRIGWVGGTWCREDGLKGEVGCAGGGGGARNPLEEPIAETKPGRGSGGLL